MAKAGRPRKAEHEKVCSICGDPDRSSASWCKRCWRLYQAARRAGKDTIAVMRELKIAALKAKRAA